MSIRHINILFILFIISGLFCESSYALEISENSVNNSSAARPALGNTARVTTPRRAAAVSNRRRTVPRRKKNIKSINAKIGKNIILTLKRKNIEGVWDLKNYSKKLLDLVENRVSVRDTYFIFKPVKKGIATIRLVFKTGERVRERETYVVKVLEPVEYSAAIQNIENTRISNIERAANNNRAGLQRNERRPERISLENNVDASSQSSENTDENSEATDPVKEKNDFELIQSLFVRQAYREAADEAEKFMKKYASSKYIVDVIITAGKSYAFSNQLNKAIDLYGKYIKKVKNPNIAYPVYFARAKAYEKLGKNNDAQIEYIKMLGILRNRSELVAKAHLLLGKLYVKINKTAMGIFEFENIIKNHPDTGEITAEAYYMLGSYYYKTRGIENYEKSYESFKKLYISFPESRFADGARRMARYLKVNYIDYR
jgi:tetratricopeptide (TPR) repeat protein